MLLVGAQLENNTESALTVAWLHLEHLCLPKSCLFLNVSYCFSLSFGLFLKFKRILHCKMVATFPYMSIAK